MDRCYDGALVMPSSYAVMDEAEMMYVEGGSAKDWAVGIACSLIANAICAIGKYAVSTGMVKTALTACATAAKAVWGGITSAASFCWNPPVAAAILAGVVGIGVGVVYAYYKWKK